MIYYNGNKYIGAWMHDNRNGKGEIFYFNGEKYNGEW